MNYGDLLAFQSTQKLFVQLDLAKEKKGAYDRHSPDVTQIGTKIHHLLTHDPIFLLESKEMF